MQWMPERDDVQTYGPGMRLMNPYTYGTPGSFNGPGSGFGNVGFGAAGGAVEPMPNADVPLQPGARSQVVATLQNLLNAHGHRLDVDGIVGSQTMAAVWDAFDRLVSSPSDDAVKLVAAGPAGMSVGQIITALSQAWAQDASVQPRRPADTVSGPSEPDARISMTPGDAVQFEKMVGLRPSGVPWGWIALGALVLGTAAVVVSRR